MRLLPVLITLLLWCPAIGTAAETSHLVFVSEYVRELGANESMREQSEKEVTAEPNGPTRFAAVIRSSTRITMELSSQISILKKMSLNDPFAELPTNIISFYDYKVKVHNQMIEMATAFISGPKPGVDYDAMAADAPKLTAMIEYIDRSLFQATPLIFAMLIDQQPDKNGHLSRLVITKAERNDLVRRLQTSFGKKLDQKDQNYTVSSASVLRDYLAKKGYKCSDEPQ
jgi:hypothetical protein